MTAAAQTVGEEPAAHVDIVGEGRPLLLLHGWGSSAELMLPIARNLQARHRCIVVDFPGHGATPPPSQPWGSDDFVAWTVALLDRLQIDSADVIGHSHGGRIGIGLAAAHPERVGKLVLVSSAGVRTPQPWRARARVRAFKAGRRLSQSPLVPAQARVRLQRWVERQGSDDYRAASGVMRATLVRMVNSDARPLLPRLRCPTLLVWGDRDESTPLAQAKEMERLIPDSGLVVFHGGSHFVYAEQLERFSTIVATFLEAP